MKTVIFIVIGSLVLLYMIDKADLVKPELPNDMIKIELESESGSESIITFESEKKNERMKSIKVYLNQSKK